MADGKLSPMQEKFVEEYLIDLNATQAAIRAGYSDKTACEQGSRLLANVKVSEAIAKARAKQSERTQITADYVLNGLKKEAEWTGEGSSHSARVTAYTQLGKHLGLFVDRHEHGGSETTPIVIRTISVVKPGENNTNGHTNGNGSANGLH